MLDVKRAWAEIDLDRAAHNLNEIRRCTGGQVIAVVKADAYGHGVRRIAQLYREMGVEYFAVACLQEALELRECGIDARVLILGPTPVEHIRKVSENRFIQAVSSLEYAREISSALCGSGGSLDVHFKVDTGMGRIGFSAKDSTGIAVTANEIAKAITLPCINPDGIFTHFADAENTDIPLTDIQLSRFLETVSALREKGIEFKLVHCANSAAVVNYNKAHLGCVRPGLLLYGLYPGGRAVGSIDLKPVMEFKASVCEVRTVRAGESISYGATFTAPCDMRVAVVSAGYADGVSRALSNRGEFLLHGKRVRILGKVCMDMCILDAQDVPEVRAGDTVTLFGSDDGAELGVDCWAECIGTISYEICSLITKRVPRVYIKDGKPV